MCLPLRRIDDDATDDQAAYQAGPEIVVIMTMTIPPPFTMFPPLPVSDLLGQGLDFRRLRGADDRTGSKGHGIGRQHVRRQKRGCDTQCDGFSEGTHGFSPISDDFYTIFYPSAQHWPKSMAVSCRPHPVLARLI